MSWSYRRAFVVLLAAALFGATALLQTGYAQLKAVKTGIAIGGAVPAPPADAKPAGPGEFVGITLPTDSRYASQIQAALDYIKDEDWVTATQVLQKLLELKEDVMVPVPRRNADGKDDKAMVSVKDEANRLIASLPPKGMEFYKLTYDPLAADLLKRAKAASDVGLLNQVVAHYLHTDAGAEATNLLGTYHLDRGRYVIASLCFARMLTREGADRLQPITLVKAAYAFHQAGDKANENLAWQKLNARSRELKVGNETKTVAELQEYVAQLAREGAERSLSDWPLFGGSESRNGQAELGGAAFMVPTWKKKTYTELDPREKAGADQVETWLKTTEAYLKDRMLPTLPAFFPVAATITTKDGKKLPMLIYRTYWGIQAVNVKDGEMLWQTKSNWSAGKMAVDPEKVQAMRQWMGYYLQSNNMGGGRPSILLDNSTVGCLSTDNVNAYWVEDLAVPPPPHFNNQFVNPGVNPGAAWGPKVNQAIQASKLMANDLATGKVKWELGGVLEAAKDTNAKKPDPENLVLMESYFLGPPLPVGGKLYVLTEKQQELRLACIDPAAGKVVSMQTLATTREKIQQDVGRRMQAAHLAYGEGILVCPTNAGAVLGVDLLSNSLLWAYPYRDKSEASEYKTGQGGLPPGFVWGPNGQMYNLNALQNQWRVCAPIIQDGKVVFTAPDAKALHCINLRDGVRLWTIPWSEKDLYLGGVFKGRVLVVSKDQVNAYTLDKGEPAWPKPLVTGLPSGQGVASDNVYYLPLKEAGRDKEPEICAIDVEHGQIAYHTRSRKKEVPGNLIFYEGDVLSQTAEAVTAYPQLKIHLAKIDEEISKDPNNPVGLTKRAELRLDKGDLQGAITDLHVALKNHPDTATVFRAKAQLFDALTEFFQTRFTEAEKAELLPEFEALCKIDPDEVPPSEKANSAQEERKRRANFLYLVGKGKEDQGNLVEAFERYQAFGALASGQDLLSVLDEPSVKAAPDVWSQGRIAAMVAKATPEQREPLEQRIRERWAKLQQSDNIEELRGFVSVFGSLFTVGREARLRLAERLMTDSDPLALLDAERQLSLLSHQKEEHELAARAIDALARLNQRKGLLDDATYYYRVLNRDFANVKVRDGKTGADLFNDLATNRFLLPYLDEPMHLAMAGSITATVENGNFPMNAQVYTFGHSGEPLPFFDRHRIGINFNYNKLTMTDKATGETKWDPVVARTMAQQIAYANGQTNAAKFNYQTLGHLIVLPLGHLVFGLDPINKKVLWQKNLHATASQINNNNLEGNLQNYQQLTVDPRDGTIQVVYQDGWMQRLGQAGTLEGNALCLQVRDGLVAIDPVTGRTLWVRNDVSTRSHVFNDEQNVYVVDVNGETPTATRAFRAYDGVSVKVPDFSEPYKKRLRFIGNRILLSDSDAKSGLTMRLYDVPTGKDLWKQEFPANSTVLQSEDHNLAGVIEPDGKLKVYDLRAGKEILSNQVDPKHLDKVKDVHLLSDGKYAYVAFNGQVDPALMPWGGVQPNMMPGMGFRSVPVNGELYSFNLATGKREWHNPVPNQMIVLEHFNDLPIVLFTSRYNKMVAVGAGRNVINVVAAGSIEKRTGKFKYNNENLPNQQNFHALNVDAKNGKIELISWQMKLVHQLNAAGAGKDGPGTSGSTPPSSGPQPTPGFRGRGMSPAGGAGFEIKGRIEKKE
jgi:outer membrane protein assembly factor BamB